MDIAVFIVERRNKILLLRNNGRWVLPGGMCDLGETKEKTLRKKVFWTVGRRVGRIFKKLEGVFSGVAPMMNCEINATVFVGDVEGANCEIPEDKRPDVGWFDKKDMSMIHLSDIAKSALCCYFAQTKGA